MKKTKRVDQPIVATDRFKFLHVDFVGPLPPAATGEEYLMTMIDRFTGFTRIRPLSSITADDAAHTLFFSWVRDFGCPEVLLSDKGTQFEAGTFKRLCALLGIEKRRTTPYYPQCNGKIERMHRTLKSIITTKIVDFPNWLYILPLAELVLNTAISKVGISPAMMAYGEQPVLPQLFFDDALRTDEVELTDPMYFFQKLSHAICNLSVQPGTHGAPD